MRHRWIAATFSAVAATLVAATIFTTAQAATLFTDDFEDGNSTGWTSSGGSWSVVTDGTRALRQSGTSSDARTLAGQSTWADYTVRARVKPVSFNGSNRFVAVLARAQSNTSYYYVTLRSTNVIELKKLVSGSSTTLATAALTVTAGQWYQVALTTAGDQLSAAVNGTTVLTARDTAFRTGRIGLATYYASASFDDVTVTDTAPPSPTASAGPTASPTASATVSPTPPVSPSPSNSSNPIPPIFCPNPPAVVGFASVNAWGQNGTIGGCGGSTVTVSSAPAFLAAIARPDPVVVQVQGMISLPGPMHDVQSHKTIVGIGANSGITGGGLNIGLPLDDDITSPPVNAVKNVIIRNMVFRNAPDDAINVQMFSHHIWIDHNDLAQGYDGLIDIKRGSSYITVSWNHTHDHDKNMLLGHDDSNGPQDIGRLKVTYHHNWFNATPQRNPRVRFGEPVHVFNNYFVLNPYVGVACQANSGCIVEGNYFHEVKRPVKWDYNGPVGRVISRHNIYTFTGAGEFEPPTDRGPVQEPSTYYAYTLAPAANIPAIVQAGAGTGKI